MDGKITISVRQCKVGMKIADTVFNKYGAVILDDGYVLDDRMIARLEQFEIDRVKIYEVPDEKELQAQRFKQSYLEQVDTVKDIIKDISAGKTLEMKKVNVVADSVIKLVNDNINIMSCINNVKTMDEYTYNHSVNVALLSMMIGGWLKLDQKKINDLIYVGLLHDIGKAKVDPAILNRPGKLSDEEYEEMKKHTMHSYRIVENIPEINKDIAMGVLMHHEREDGSGYMLGVKGDQISEYAKIVAVADVYDAMTSDRVYRVKRSPFEVFKHLQEGSFKEFDPNISIIFINMIAKYYIGDICRLSSGEVGEIIHINPSDVSKPLIKVDNAYVDLSKEMGISIVEMM